MGDQHGLLRSLARLLPLFYLTVHNEIRNKGFRLSLKRILILWLLSVILPSLLIWNHIGFYLDDILFPAWRHNKVIEPVFLIGNARSGTTWLHRLLTQVDEKVFISFRTYEILFAVSITWKVLFHVLYRLDHIYLFGSTFSLIQAADGWLWGNVQIHPIGMLKPEEDEWLMMHIGLSQLLLFFFPTASEHLKGIVHYDCPASYLNADVLKQLVTNTFIHKQKDIYLDLDIEEPLLDLPMRLSIFHYYKQCVQRHIYFYTHIQSSISHASISDLRSIFKHHHAPVSKTKYVFVSKNPAFTLRLESLYAVFPDAKVICLLRDPAQSVPSMLSYISKVWQLFCSPVASSDSSNISQELLSFCKAHYLYPLLQMHVHNEHVDSMQHRQHIYSPNSMYKLNKGIFVSYHALQQDLKGSLQQLLAELLEGSGLKSCMDWSRIEIFLDQQQMMTSNTASTYPSYPCMITFVDYREISARS